MSLLRTLSLTFALTLPLAAIGATSQVVTISAGLTGTWLKPAEAWDGRTVLFLHGFADDKDGAGDLTRHTAEFLATKGIASLRIDFRGEGDKKREHIESTFQTRIADTESSYRFLVSQAGVAKGHIAVAGWSLGASTAIEVASEHPEWFSTMVLWSSPAGDQFKMFLTMPMAQQAEKDGEGMEEVPGWKKIYTKKAFYDSFKGYDLDRSIAKYKGPILAVRGTEDFLPHADEELLKAAGSAKSQAIMIGGADHIFKVFNPELGYEKRLIEATDRWLETTI